MVIFKYLYIPTEKQMCFSYCFDALWGFLFFSCDKDYGKGKVSGREKRRWGSKEQLKLFRIKIKMELFLFKKVIYISRYKIF